MRRLAEDRSDNAGRGNDAIRLVSAASGRVDAGPGHDGITEIVSRGRARVSCCPGDDVANVSKFTSNRRRVSVAKRCERIRRG